MNDPHVESLSYHFISENPNDTFDDASVLSETLGPFKLELQDGKLTVWPQTHYENVESVKQDLEPFLHSWESSAFLDPKRARIRFKYDQAHIIDRRPTPAKKGEVTGRISLFLAGAELTATGTVSSVRQNTEYPSPNPFFRSSRLTDELIAQIKQYQDGRLPITFMAFWVLTKLENEYDGRKNASRAMNVSKSVLNKLGELSSSTDPELGRKATGSGPPHLTSAQLQWMDNVVLRLTRRVGEISGDHQSPPKITISDFPALD